MSHSHQVLIETQPADTWQLKFRHSIQIRVPVES